MANGKVGSGSKGTGTTGQGGGQGHGKGRRHECTPDEICAYLEDLSVYLQKLRDFLKTTGPGGDKTGGPPPPTFP